VKTKEAPEDHPVANLSARDRICLLQNGVLQEKHILIGPNQTILGGKPSLPKTTD